MWSPARQAGCRADVIISCLHGNSNSNRWILKFFKWLLVYLQGHGRCLSFWRFLSRGTLSVYSHWWPLQILEKNCFFRDNFSSHEWISLKLCSCNALRARMLPFDFGPDICSYLPLDNVICPWQNIAYSAIFAIIYVLMNGCQWNFVVAIPLGTI